MKCRFNIITSVSVVSESSADYSVFNMKIKYNRERLNVWLVKAYKSNLMYYRTRRVLFDDLVDCIDLKGSYSPDPALMNTIRSNLMVRNDWLDDNKLLSLLTAIESLIADIEEKPSLIEEH